MTILSTIRQDAQITAPEVASLDNAISRGEVNASAAAEFAEENWDIFEPNARSSMNALLSRIGAPTVSLENLSDLQSRPQLANVFSGATVLGQDRNPLHPGVRLVQRGLMALARRNENPDLMPASGADGNFGPNTEAAVRAFQEEVMRLPDDEVDGLIGPDTIAALDQALRDVPVTGASTGGSSSSSIDLPFQPNSSAVRAAAGSSPGQRFAQRTPMFKEAYKRAEQLTGVPASFLAALHANESGQGEIGAGALGPESGFGLDDRWVTTAWANRFLDQYGLGRWARGSGSASGVLQSAVVAAEHFKRNARTIGVDVNSHMNTRQIAGAITSYTSGVRMGQRALSTGRSWMFDPSDANPHPLHPGGTSRSAGGRTIRIPAGRKTGLLRWDVLLPLANDLLR